MRRVTVGCVVLAVCAAAGCSKTLGMDVARKAISAGLSEKLEVVVTAVTCPESREIKAGDTFECKAAVQTGGELVIKVTQKDDQGNIGWELTNTWGLIDLRALEAQITGGLKEQVSVDATVSCAGKYRVSVPGRAFECQAKAGESQRVVAVTIKDDKGNVGWEVK